MFAFTQLGRLIGSVKPSLPIVLTEVGTTTQRDMCRLIGQVVRTLLSLQDAQASLGVVMWDGGLGHFGPCRQVLYPSNGATSLFI